MNLNFKDITTKHVKKPEDSLWTDEQWDAITDDGKNILVSAGAGSGKTAVLSERVLIKLKEGIPLKSLIILTFTKAAAAEMKERIRSKIEEEIKRGNTKLIDEYEYVDQANIQTFDSFALELVKKYHYILGIEKNISKCDEALLKIVKKDVINSLFKEYYDANDDDFNHLIEYFCLKDDGKLKEELVDLDETFDLLSDRNKYLSEYASKFLNEVKLKEIEREYIESIFSRIKYIKEAIKMLKNLSTDSLYQDGVGKIEENYKEFFEAKTLDELKNAKLGRKLPSKKIEESLLKILNEQKAKCKGMLDQTREHIVLTDTNKQIELLLEQKKLVLKIIEIINEFNKRISDYKEQNNTYSFMDIAKLAIILFRENAEIRKEMSESISEIMVDEYQDTSDVQEDLINLIGNNNIYMVGDIKQSIYRFRNANPDIFSDKYLEYKKDTNNNRVIELAKNFRSREEVLCNINLIFNKVMDLKFGGADYNDGHALIFGNKKYSKYKDHNNDFEIYTYTKDEVERLQYGNKEAEAIIIANDIIDKISSGYKVLDGDKLRDATYKDFCILAPVKTDFDFYKRIFEMMGIPLMIHKDKDFIEGEDVVSIINLFRFINLFKTKKSINDMKYSLVSILRSFIFRVDNDTINTIMINENFLEELKNILPEIYNKVQKLAKIIGKVTVKEFAEEVFSAFDIYKQIIKLPNTDDVENNIGFLLDKCDELSKLGYDLEEYIKYFDEIRKIDEDVEISTTSNTSGNVVNMMTIHKSKGLEYNVCYFPSLYSKFKYSELNNKIVFNKDLGIIIPIFDEGFESTYIKRLLKMKLREAEISERLRLLYVALTRAKDKFIVVCEDFEEESTDYSYNEMGKLLYNSLYDIFNSINKDTILYKNVKIVPSSKKDLCRTKILETSNHTEFINLDIKENVIVKKHASKVSSVNVVTKEDKAKMRLGTEMHRYLEVIDFNNFEEEVNSLNTNNYYKTKLLKFFENYKLVTKGAEIIDIYKEYEFMYEDPTNKTYLNGIIDLLVETNKGFIIIDYKLKQTDKEEYIKQMNEYNNYIKELTNKDVVIYLYSIIDETFNIVEL